MLKKLPQLLLLFSLFFLFIFTSFFKNLHQQYVLEAYSFLNSKLYFLDQFGPVYDASLFNNHQYWPLGPLPAILLFPTIIVFGNNFPHQGFVTLILTIAIYYLLKKLVVFFGFRRANGFWLILLFLFATPYFGVSFIAHSWYFAHVVATFFFFASLNFFLIDKKNFFAGLFLGLATLSRLTILPAILFFILEIFLSKKKKNIRNDLLKIMLPFIGCLLIYGFYNFSRFGNFLESGYSFQIINGEMPEKRLQCGLANWQYVPLNFHNLFLRGILPIKEDNFILFFSNPSLAYLGIGLIVSIPIFFVVFLCKSKFLTNFHSRNALIASLIIIFSLLFSFSTGGIQLGNRLALDFLPLWFLIILASVNKKISLKWKLLILYQFLLNVYLFIPQIKLLM